MALVTGAGSESGIGFATAKMLGGLGASVAVSATTERIYDRQEELRDLGVPSVGVVGDLTDGAAVERMLTVVTDALGTPLVVVNNAGMGSIRHPEELVSLLGMGVDSFRRHLEINVVTAFSVINGTLAPMLEAGWGRLIQVASVTGVVQTNPGESGYAAGKSALVGLTRTIALEVAGSGVTCNAVAPGWVGTGAQTPLERLHGLASPMGRSATPDEVAAAVVFLALPVASYCNGITLVVDGANSLQEGPTG
ncbi:MAG: SDR family NAD(P)-dependent oxidoreductase [Ferrimicrobium sp.]